MQYMSYSFSAYVEMVSNLLMRPSLGTQAKNDRNIRFLQFCTMLVFSVPTGWPSRRTSFATIGIMHIVALRTRIQMPHITAGRIVTMMQSSERWIHAARIDKFPGQAMRKDVLLLSISEQAHDAIAMLIQCSMPFKTTVGAHQSMLTDLDPFPQSYVQRTANRDAMSIFFLPHDQMAWITTCPFLTAIENEKALRNGMLMPNFPGHSVSHFVYPLLPRLDTESTVPTAVDNALPLPATDVTAHSMFADVDLRPKPLSSRAQWGATNRTALIETRLRTIFSSTKFDSSLQYVKDSAACDVLTDTFYAGRQCYVSLVNSYRWSLFSAFISLTQQFQTTTPYDIQLIISWCSSIDMPRIDTARHITMVQSPQSIGQWTIIDQLPCNAVRRNSSFIAIHFQSEMSIPVFVFGSLPQPATVRACVSMRTKKDFFPKSCMQRFATEATYGRTKLTKARTLKDSRGRKLKWLSTRRILTDTFDRHAQPPLVERDSTRVLRPSVEAGSSGRSDLPIAAAHKYNRNNGL
jgi:hypothetical protein